MKTLKNCIKLSCSVKIYVPSTLNITEVADTQIWIDKSLNLLSVKFGGATASKALGAWISSQGQLVKENVTMVFSYASQHQLEQGIEEIHDFCIEMKRELAQEAIALEVNNELYLI